MPIAIPTRAGSSPPGYLVASSANTGSTRNRPSMRAAKIVAREALARRSVGVIREEMAEAGGDFIGQRFGSGRQWPAKTRLSCMPGNGCPRCRCGGSARPRAGSASPATGRLLVLQLRNTGSEPGTAGVHDQQDRVVAGIRRCLSEEPGDPEVAARIERYQVRIAGSHPGAEQPGAHALSARCADIVGARKQQAAAVHPDAAVGAYVDAQAGDHPWRAARIDAKHCVRNAPPAAVASRCRPRIEPEDPPRWRRAAPAWPQTAGMLKGSCSLDLLFWTGLKHRLMAPFGKKESAQACLHLVVGDKG